MTMLDTIEEYLQETGTPFTHTKHRLAFTAREVARAEQLAPRTMAKTVVTHDEDGYGLAVIPGDCLVDLHELRCTLKRAQMRLATETEIARLFPDCELGAMPPLGNLRGLPVYVDATLASQDIIAFNAGTHRDSVHMRYVDFAKLVQPQVLQFARQVTPRPMAAWDL